MAATTIKVPLSERAVHPFTLLYLTTQQVHGKSLGELTSSEVISLFVKPNTETANADYIQATARKYARHPWNRELKFKDDMPASASSLGVERLAKDKALCGPATYFVSHCWGYKFKDLVSLIIRHYDAQPATEGGRVWAPIFYWVDLFAVQQNFKGDFKDHPDSDFPAVIRVCQAVLFTIMPWRAPLCVERVWCLFEALQAVNAHVELQLLVEQIESPQTMDKLQQTFTNVVVNNLDIRKCKATVAADRVYILKQVEGSLGVDKFNAIMQDALRRKVQEVMLLTAVQRNDLDSATKLVKGGVRITQPVVSFTGYTAFNTDDKGLKALGELLKISAVSAVTLHTTAASKATAEGYQALMVALKSNATLTDLTLAKAPRDDLKKHEGGWVGPKAAAAIADWLESNSTLRRLNLSRNLKLGGPGLTHIAKGLASAENSALQEVYLSECGGEPKSMAAVADALATGAQPSLTNAAAMGSSWAASGRIGSGGGLSVFSGVQASGGSFTGGMRSGLSFTAGAAARASGPLGGLMGSGGSFTLGASPLQRKLSPSDSFKRSSGLLARPRMPIMRADLSHNSIGDGEGATAVGRLLKATNTLRVLELRHCDMGPGGMKGMSDGLGAAGSVTKLDLSHNKIGDDGATALAAGLKKNKSVQVLLLIGCDIKAAGAKELGAVLRSAQCPLQDLTLSHNPLADAGGVHIGAGVRGNSTLTRLDLSSTGLAGKEGIAGVAAALWANKTLKELDLRSNKVKTEEADACVRSLSDSLQGNGTLAKLYLAGTLTEAAAAKLVALQDSLKQLEVDMKTPKEGH